MDSIWSEKIDLILRVGRFLGDVGVRNWALTKPQALSALTDFEAAEIGVLGGDVYEFKGGIIQPNYDSWHVDKQEGENNRDFVARSIKAARAYITKYPSNQDDFFVLVPDEVEPSLNPKDCQQI